MYNTYIYKITNWKYTFK